MDKITRRKFIDTTVKGAALISAQGVVASCSVVSDDRKIPTRILGKTGLEVPILSFGGGTQFQKNKEGEWQKLLEEGVKSGIKIFDTAPGYNYFNTSPDQLASDQKYGEILSKYRDKVLLSTKVDTRNVDKMKVELKESLARLKTDHIDILLLHSISQKDNVDEIEKGVYKEMQALKKAGIVRFIGFSSMSSAERSKEMLEKLDVDIALMAFNPTMYGNYADIALPAAVKQNTGVMAMKVFRNLVGDTATPEELFHYAFSLNGISTVLVGHIGVEQLRYNVSMAKNFDPELVAKIDHKELESRLAQYAGPHKLCWARPDYTDGMTMA
jgi:predicted aldo/keto reductase-like oxidoreductase